MRKPAARHRVPEHLFELRDQFVAIAGEIAAVQIEQDPDPRKVDHVWISVRAGESGRLQISLSTMSRHCRAAGLDPRVRVGTIASSWSELPPAGVHRAAPLDYTTLEAAQPIDYIAYERSALEQLLVEKAERAIYVEAWGEFYIRAHIGVHQVHSRRASIAVPRDLVGEDGAVRFYFARSNTSEMLLFKFAGQP